MANQIRRSGYVHDGAHEEARVREKAPAEKVRREEAQCGFESVMCFSQISMLHPRVRVFCSYVAAYEIRVLLLFFFWSVDLKRSTNKQRERE